MIDWTTDWMQLALFLIIAGFFVISLGLALELIDRR